MRVYLLFVWPHEKLPLRPIFDRYMYSTCILSYVCMYSTCILVRQRTRWGWGIARGHVIRGKSTIDRQTWRSRRLQFLWLIDILHAERQAIHLKVTTGGLKWGVVRFLAAACIYCKMNNPITTWLSNRRNTSRLQYWQWQTWIREHMKFLHQAWLICIMYVQYMYCTVSTKT